MEDLPARLQQIKTRIGLAAKAAGRTEEPLLLAVSKGQGAEQIRALYALGQRRFGENYFQELRDKAASLQDLSELSWSFIGVLQSNKIKQLVRLADEIQSVDSFDKAKMIAGAATAAGRTPYPVWILVNAAGETSKHGIKPSDVPALATAIAEQLPALRLKGVMAIPPPPEEASAFSESPMTVPPLYAMLRILASQTGEGLLSLGMTGDLEQAIAAGSDCVRIGTALFGPRR